MNMIGMSRFFFPDPHLNPIIDRVQEQQQPPNLPKLNGDFAMCLTDVTPIVAKRKLALTAGLKIRVWIPTTQGQEDLSMVVSATAVTHYLFSAARQLAHLNQVWQNWDIAFLEASRITPWSFRIRGQWLGPWSPGRCT